MGINLQTLKILNEISKNNIIKGNILILGKQDFGTSEIELKSLKPHLLNKKISYKKNIVDDRLYFKAISNSLVNNIDILDVRKGMCNNIIEDLNFKVSKKFYRKYDFIFDGSVLDNIFSPAQAIQNLHLMLKEKGTILQVNNSGFCPGVFTALSPEFFYSFYALNNYAHCEVFLTVQKKQQIKKNNYLCDLYRYSPFYKKKKNFNLLDFCISEPGIFRTFVIATKGKIRNKKIKIPTNLQYIFYQKDNYKKIKYKNKYLKFTNHKTKQKSLLNSHYTLIKKNF